MLLFCEASAQGEQVSNYFLDHLLKVSKSQNLFSTVCSSWADTQFYFLKLAQGEQTSNFIFWGLLKVSRYSILFFEVCSSCAGIQFYFLKLAQGEQMLKFILWGLLKLRRRGGACVPARTSAQRRFHPKMRCCHPRKVHTPSVKGTLPCANIVFPPHACAT